MGRNSHGDVVEIALDVQRRLNSGAASNSIDPRSGVGLRDTSSGDVLALRTWWHAESATSKRRRGVVIDDGSDGTCGTGKSRLEAELTSTTLDKRDLALYLSRVVGSFAAQCVDRDDFGRDIATGRVLEEGGFVGSAVDRDLTLHVTVERGERLSVDSPGVAESLNGFNQVIDCVVVALRAHDPIAIRGGVGNVLQILSLGQKVVDVDSSLKSRRVDERSGAGWVAGRRSGRGSMSASLGRLPRLTRLARLARRVTRRVSRGLWGLLAGTVVCRRDVRKLGLLRSGSGGQANGGRENGCGGDLHGDE